MRWFIALVTSVIFTTVVSAQTGAVSVELAPGVNGVGSGTVIWVEGGYSFVLTNKHVAEPSGNISFTIDGIRYPAQRGVYADGADLALIYVTGELKPAKLASINPAPDRKVVHYGVSSKEARGRVIGEHIVKHSFGATYVCVPGDSGAALFDDDNRIVGVNWGRTAYGVNDVALFAPVSEVQAMLVKAAPVFPRFRVFVDRLKDDKN